VRLIAHTRVLMMNQIYKNLVTNHLVRYVNPGLVLPRDRLTMSLSAVHVLIAKMNRLPLRKCDRDHEV
jgi:hypothetical protein